MRTIEDCIPFVPSNDYEVSKAFFRCMGFRLNWGSEEVCEIDTRFGYRFLFLPRNHNNYAHSLMPHFMVNSAQQWQDHFAAIELTKKFRGGKVAPPEFTPWGLLITRLWDPAGVLLHFAERPGEKPWQAASYPRHGRTIRLAGMRCDTGLKDLLSFGQARFIAFLQRRS